MKHLQNVRGKWIVRVTVPEDLREIIGKRELIDNNLPTDLKARERKAVAVINSFYAMIDDAREVLLARQPTLSTAAKEHYRAELEADDKGRAVRSADTADFERYSRSVYANKLRLLVAGQIEKDEAEALIGYPKDVHDMITGHADQSVAAVYVHDTPLKRMADALNKVTFDLPIRSLAT